MLDGRSGDQGGPPIGDHPIKVFGMYYTPPPPTHPLLSRQPRIVHPALAYEVDRSIRQSGPHIGGDRLNKSPKLTLIALDSFLCLLRLCYIDDRTCKLETIGIDFERPCENSNMLDSFI